MAKNLIEYSAATADIVSYANYDSTKTVLGPDIRQFTGSSASEYWIGPSPTRFQDPTQDTGLSNWGDIDAITYSGSKQWVFALRGFATNNANAEIAAWEFDKDTYEYTYKGRTTVTPPTLTAGTWQGIKSNLEYYSTGSVEVNGTTVIGTGTNFIADRIPVGARIGFGSTNPADITTWYRISSYPSMSFKTGFNNTANTTAVDASGSLYVGGNFTTYQDVTATRIIKLNSDGTIDSSFNSGAGFNGIVNIIRIDSSGSLYVGGAFTTYSGSTNNYIIKLNPDGTKDTSFDNTTGFNSYVNDIQFDSSGSLWVGGAFTTYKGASSPRLAKILTTGLRDTTYVTTNSPNNVVYTVAVDSNDDVYIGGGFTQVGATANNSRYIAKILKTGGLDASFVVGTAGTSNAFNNIVNTIHYKTATNSITVGGNFTQWKGATGNAYLIELSAVGDVIKGTSASAVVYSMVSDGTNLYVNLNSIIAKYNLSTLESDNSSTSPTFCPNITYDALNSPSFLMALSLDGSKLYVTSGDTAVDAGLVVVDTTYGNHDLTFATTPDYVSQVLSIDSSAGTLSSGTPYVVENLQLTMVSSQNGIVFMQGISWDDFTVAGTTISTPSLDYAALNKGAYRLRDRGYNETLKYFNTADSLNGWNDTRNNPKQNESVNYLYIRGTSNNFSRLNLKNSQLRIHGTNAQANIAFSTFDQAILPNSLGLGNFASGKFTIGTMQTGSASGSYSIYGDTSAGIVQIDIDSLSNYGTPTYTQITETPPGSTTTYPAAGNVSRIYYMPAIDRLIVLNASTTAKSYITNYLTDLQFPTLTSTLYGRDTFNQLAIDNSYDLAFLGNFNQLQGNTANSNAPRYPDTLGTGFFGAVENGVLHLCRPLNTIQNNMYAMPLGCEAQFVNFSNEVFITPKYTLPNVVAISGLYVNSLKQYGSVPFALPPEPIIIHYRTSGIDDNSGAWTEYTTIDALNDSLECEGVLQTINIQFRFSYKIAGNTCLPNRIYGFTLVYEDDRTDSHYAPSIIKSDLTNRIFAWQQVEPWYGNIPELKIRLYNTTNNKIVYYDTTATNASGTWQYSTDGTTWLTWNNTADAVGNYIRYTADFIPSGIKLRVGLNKI